MKKNRILLLCLFALISIVVLVSCFQEDPIKDNRIIGTWTAEKGTGTFTLVANANQTFVRTEKLVGEEIKIEGTWDASSVNEGTLKKKGGPQIAHFTAYGEKLEYYDDTLGGEKTEYTRVK